MAPVHLLVFALVACVLLLAALVFWSGERHLSVPYSALIEQVEAGRVEAVTVEGQRVRGSFDQPMRLVGGRLIGANEPLPDGIVARGVPADADFEAVIPASMEEDFIDLLESGDALIDVEEAEDGSLWSSLLIVGLPVFLLAGFLLVTRRGMTEAVGLQVLDDEDGGEGMVVGRVNGERTRDTADAAIRQLLDEAFARAEHLLRTRRDVLDRLAEALIAEETLDQLRIVEVFEADGPGAEQVIEIERAPVSNARTPLAGAD